VRGDDTLNPEGKASQGIKLMRPLIVLDKLRIESVLNRESLELLHIRCMYCAIHLLRLQMASVAAISTTSEIARSAIRQ